MIESPVSAFWLAGMSVQPQALAAEVVFAFGGESEGKQQRDEDQYPGGVEEVPVNQAVTDAGMIIAGDPFNLGCACLSATA